MMTFFSFDFVIKISDAIRCVNTKIQKLYYYSSVNVKFEEAIKLLSIWDLIPEDYNRLDNNEFG